jgi:hypothetical protein
LRRGVLSLDACLQKLRYVKYGDEVRASDVLAKLECLKALRDTLKAKAAEMGCPSERIDPLVDQLDSILATIRYVRSGDVIQPEDHNYVVDALKKARDILAEIESYCAGLKDQLDKCLEDLEKCQADLVACQALIKPGYPVVPWNVLVQVAMSEVHYLYEYMRSQVAMPEFQQASDIKLVLEYYVGDQVTNDIRLVLEYTIS